MRVFCVAHIYDEGEIPGMFMGGIEVVREGGGRG